MIGGLTETTTCVVAKLLVTTIAVPCENPPIMILLLGMPLLTSPSIILNTESADRLTPSISVSSSKLSRDSISNQAGIRKPRLSDIGITGAVGQMTCNKTKLYNKDDLSI